MCDTLDEAKEWSRHHLECKTRSGRGVAAVVSAAAELPLPPRASFELMAHPDNAAIFRGIERCTYRQVLWASERGDGRQTVEVENESDWHFLFFKGSIQTRMLVHEDPTAGTIHVRLAPTGGTAPLQHMTGKWTFGPGRTPGSARVTLEQEVHPRGLHPFFHNGFRAVAGLQVRKTFEDLYAEALRCAAGKPSLPPYAGVAAKAVALPGCGGGAPPRPAPGAPGRSGRRLPVVREEGGGDDPASVLGFDDDSSSSSSAAGLAAAASAGRGPLRSHPIGSLLDLACLAGATGASLAAEAAAHAAAAAAEAAAAAAKDARAAGESWRGRLYGLVQRLWLASNAALGLGEGAVEQLEEMAVLV